MTNNLNTPREYDAVLGGQAPPPVNSAVLGGLDGVRNRLASGILEVQQAALSDALKYGSPGLELLVQALKNESIEIQKAAYFILRKQTESTVRIALKEYSPYKYFECLKTLKGNLGGIISISVSPGGDILASNGTDKTLKVWNLHSGKEILTIKGSSAYERHHSVALNIKNKTVISSMDGDIFIWDLNTGDLLNSFHGEHRFPIHSLIVSPDGTFFISAGGNTINIWDARNGNLIHHLDQAHPWGVNSIALSSDAKILVSGGRDKIIRVWDVNNGNIIKTFEDNLKWVYSVALSLDNQIIAGGIATKIKVWDLNNGKLLQTLEGNRGDITSLIICNDNQTIISGCLGGQIKIWDLNSGKLIKIIDESLNGVSSILLTSDEQKFISAGRGVDKSIKIWGIK
jgi:WD40 repeat protein